MTQGPNERGAVDLGAVGATAGQRPSAGGGFAGFISATASNVEEEVLRYSAKIPVVVLVGTDRSPESVQLKATFEELARDQRAFRVAYVDADSAPAVAQMFGVRALPTAIAVAAGRPVTSFEGNQPAAQLSQWVDALVSQIGPQLAGLGEEDGAEQAEETDPRFEAAAEALERADFAAARAIYDDILAAEPKNAEAKRARAMVAVLERVHERGASQPEGVEATLAAADDDVARGEPERAFDLLLELVRTEPRAKERLLELFEAYEPGDRRVIAARTRLASALF
ncbi:tetratricopeptide repeat protein [Corynebacterium liangguodongii]|uniref:Co-chaperone YbbN n=1 Tax=Corynebacterium liangguodongii TaxID=2079535 RepID=A0A2S0WDJ1_9CORY|nr:tetratricopeptide repeat protein [Corynebacterium liangguodongii]AWB83838.1 co-chaperone YbbN [Corynebacterium liangguodongii]PWB98958.1 co-chaperone YbbN [Corynebacterium liangguodongii]